MKLVVEVVGGQLVQGPEPAQRMVDDEDVDVTEGVLRRTDDALQATAGSAKSASTCATGPPACSSSASTARRPPGVRALVLGRPRVDEDAVAGGQQPPRDREADPVPPADAGHDGCPGHAANLLPLWMNCH